MAAIAIVVALAAAACAFGLRLLRPTAHLQFASLLERALFAAATGMGAAAYLILALGLVHRLHAWAIAVVFVALAAASPRELWELASGLGRGLRAWFSQPRSMGGAAATFFLLAMSLLAILGALAPSSQNDWDGLSYHLAVPKLYVQHHGISFIGWLSHSNFPFTLEMLYAAGLALDGQAAAKLWHTFCAALVILAILAFGQAHWQPRHGALAAAVFVSAPIVAWEATAALNDLAAALLVLLALYAFVNWWSERGQGWLHMAGIMCGFALGVKMNALVTLGFLVIAAAYHRTVTQRDGAAAGLRAAGTLALVAVVVASPWYVKSYLWTGNPVYPFFFDLFGGKYWTAEAARLYRAEQVGFGMGHGLLAAALAPWNIAMHGARFSNFPQRPLIYTSIGPLLLALLPGLILLGRLNRRVKFLLTYSLVASCAWFGLSQQMRYAIPLLPPLALCAGFSGSEIMRKLRRELRPFVIGAVLLACALSLGTFAFVVEPGIPAALRLESQDAYLARTLDGLHAMARVVNSLPAGSRVIMYGETRGFYFDTPYMWGDHHHNMIPYDRLADSAQLIAAYRELDVTDVLMTTHYLEEVRKRAGKLAQLLDDALETRALRITDERGDLILLHIEQPHL